MLTQVRNRQTTDDIDVLLKDVEDSTTSSLFQTFKAAARSVATNNKIPEKWLNDNLVISFKM